MNMRKILVLIGPSAVGKTTVMGEIIRVHPEFEFIRSATTRAPRGDGHDSEYIYLTETEFLGRVKRGEMLEYTRFGENLYGTPSSEIERIFDCGKIPLLILDINGVSTLKGSPRTFETCAVYLTADIEVLDERLYARMIKDGNIQAYERRKAQNRYDLANLSKICGLFSAVIKNSDVKACAMQTVKAFYKQK